MSRRFDSALVIVAVLGLWSLGYQVLGSYILSPPGQTVLNAIGLLASADFWPHVGATATAFALGVLGAWVGGLAIGAVLGLNRAAGEIADPLVGALYAIPKITLYPVILLLCGLGLSAKVAFAMLHGIFPVIIFTMNGVLGVSPQFLKVARALNLSRRSTLLTVLAPAALPEIMTGLRIGFAACILGTFIGEMFASSAGLGYLLVRSIGNNDVPRVMAITLVVFAVAVGANSLLLLAQRRVLR